jgi:hypothetical protein
MKKQSIFIGLLAVLLFIGQSAISQTISYQDSWEKQGFTLQEDSKSNAIVNYSLTSFNFEELELDQELMKTIKVPGIFLPNDEGAPDLPGFKRPGNRSCPEDSTRYRTRSTSI